MPSTFKVAIATPSSNNFTNIPRLWVINENFWDLRGIYLPSNSTRVDQGWQERASNDGFESDEESHKYVIF